MASASPADIRRIHPDYRDLYLHYFENDDSEGEFSGFEDDCDILDKVAPENCDFFEEFFLGEDSDDEFLGFDGAPESESESDSEENNNTQDCQQDPPQLHDWRWVDGDRPKPNNDFTGPHGMNENILPEPEAIDFVNLFLDDLIYEALVDETNRYAQAYLDNNNLRTNSRFSQWPTDGITVNIMRTFIALIVAMGLVDQESVPDYWSTDPIISMPFYSGVMPRDMFLNILSFLHLSDNQAYIPRGRPGYQPLAKLGIVYQNIVQRFGEVWSPGEHLCIDEAMIPFRGKTHMRVYAPDKPCKYGLRCYVLCDADNAYCCQFKLYTGKTTAVPSVHGRTYDLVMSLIAPYLDCGRKLTVDNYYTSPQLFMDLYARSTGATGTARAHRKNMPNLKDVLLKDRGDKAIVHCGPLVCLKVKDSKVVHLLSTVYSCNPVPTGKRTRQGDELTRPEVIKFFLTKKQ